MRVDKNTFAINAIWKMAETLLTKGSTTVISIILARILMPEDYGIIALTSVFTNLSAILVQGGIDTTLIRKETVDDDDYFNAFLMSVLVSLVCYGIMWFAAPYIAVYYSEPLLKAVLRVQMLGLFISALGIVRNAKIVREFQFKKIFYINAIAKLIGGAVGVFLAYRGFGVWSIVIYSLFSDALSTAAVLTLVRWKMTWHVSLRRMKKLFSFSSWMLLSSILDFCGNNIYNTVFGKKYSMQDLGYYSKGNQLPELICLNTYGAMTSVLLPTMANYQNEDERLKAITRKVAAMSAFIIFPMMGGLAVAGRQIVIFLFTEKWLPCVPILWATAAYFGINIFRQVNMQVVFAKGNSRLSVWIHGIRFLLLMLSVTLGASVLKFNIYQIAFLSAAIGLVVVLITQYMVKRYIHYTYGEWLKDIFPAIWMTALMMVGTGAVGYLPFPNTLKMVLQVISGIAIYWLTALISKNKNYASFVEIVKGLLHKNR